MKRSQNWINYEVITFIFELTDGTYRTCCSASQEVYRKNFQSTLFSYIFN